ncbi:uncharacterized protein LOC124280410 isoform X2 [Haliotis rubra]|uniref:uncharacterized protein LOC124280410 isoform X2 n=1 Tax=Haliotis rubra TaxID=36100 RepID=UPI001EE51CD4|nr:uncharacterized protein LOC124280410 isoform X2 [Haliotis rubra]
MDGGGDLPRAPKSDFLNRIKIKLAGQGNTLQFGKKNQMVISSSSAGAQGPDVTEMDPSDLDESTTNPESLRGSGGPELDLGGTGNKVQISEENILVFTQLDDKEIPMEQEPSPSHRSLEPTVTAVQASSSPDTDGDVVQSSTTETPMNTSVPQHSLSTSNVKSQTCVKSAYGPDDRSLVIDGLELRSSLNTFPEDQSPCHDEPPPVDLSRTRSVKLQPETGRSGGESPGFSAELSGNRRVKSSPSRPVAGHRQSQHGHQRDFPPSAERQQTLTRQTSESGHMRETPQRLHFREVRGQEYHRLDHCCHVVDIRRRSDVFGDVSQGTLLSLSWDATNKHVVYTSWTVRLDTDIHRDRAAVINQLVDDKFRNLQSLAGNIFRSYTAHLVRVTTDFSFTFGHSEQRSANRMIENKDDVCTILSAHLPVHCDFSLEVSNNASYDVSREEGPEDCHTEVPADVQIISEAILKKMNLSTQSREENNEIAEVQGRLAKMESEFMNAETELTQTLKTQKENSERQLQKGRNKFEKCIRELQQYQSPVSATKSSAPIHGPVLEPNAGFTVPPGTQGQMYATSESEPNVLDQKSSPAHTVQYSEIPESPTGTRYDIGFMNKAEFSSRGAGSTTDQQPSGGPPTGQRASTGVATSQQSSGGPPTGQRASTGVATSQQSSGGPPTGQRASTGVATRQQSSGGPPTGQRASTGVTTSQQSSGGPPTGQRAPTGAPTGQKAATGTPNGHQAPQGARIGKQSTRGAPTDQQAPHCALTDQQAPQGTTAAQPTYIHKDTHKNSRQDVEDLLQIIPEESLVTAERLLQAFSVSSVGDRRSHPEVKRLADSIALALQEEGRPPSRSNGPDTILCLDVSDSIGQNGQEQLKEAANVFIDGIEDVAEQFGLEENIGVVAMGGRSTVVQELTNDFGMVREAIDNLKFGGRSPLFEALLVCAAAVKGRGGILSIGDEHKIRPRIIFITDGLATSYASWTGSDGWSSDHETKVKLIQLVQQFLPKNNSSAPHPIAWVPVGKADRGFLKSLAKLGHGEVVERDNIAKLSRNYRIQGSIGKILICVKTGSESSSIETLAEALLGDMDPEEKSAIVEAVKRKLDHTHTGGDDDDDDDDNMEPNDFKRFREKNALLALGTRVSRGPDWKWGDQDSGGPGTVINHAREDNLVWVCWDFNSTCCRYRYGYENNYDLLVTDTARYLCDDELIEIGNKVQRGRDWAYGNQDGGPGNHGVVIRKSPEGKVKVRWFAQDTICTYNYGCDGRFDLEICKPDFETPPRKPSPVPATSDSVPTVVAWEWCDNAGAWTLYDVETSQKLEKEFQRNGNGSCLIQKNGKSFRVVYKKDPMIEKSVSGNEVHNVRRIA